MGYESKLYVVRKFDNILNEEKGWAQVIAMFDMCKFYELSNAMRTRPKTDCFIYADDEDTKILEDKYGEELTEASPQYVIDILESFLEENKDYWRVFTLLAFLKSLVKIVGQDKNIVVLHYGY